MVRIQHIHCHDPDWMPGQGTKMLHAMQHGLKKKKRYCLSIVIALAICKVACKGKDGFSMVSDSIELLIKTEETYILLPDLF